MNILTSKPFWIFTIVIVSMVFTFQNCAPAKVTGSPTTLDAASSSDPQAQPPSTNSVTNPTPVPAPTPPIMVHLRSRVNNTAFWDAPSDADGTIIHLWTQAGNTNQDFYWLSTGELQVHGRCVVSGGASTASVTISACSGAANQMWSYDKATSAIVSKEGLCVDVPNSDASNGMNLITYGCHGGINQQFDLVY